MSLLRTQPVDKLTIYDQSGIFEEGNTGHGIEAVNSIAEGSKRNTVLVMMLSAARLKHPADNASDKWLTIYYEIASQCLISLLDH